MTDRDATTLLVQLDAMRLARAEDARTCERLTARVKELEAEVARWRAETRAPPLPIVGCDCNACRVLRRHQMEARRFSKDPGDAGFTERLDRPLAEGTRDETAARCGWCDVPVACGTHCAACAVGL